MNLASIPAPVLWLLVTIALWWCASAFVTSAMRAVPVATRQAIEIRYPRVAWLARTVRKASMDALPFAVSLASFILGRPFVPPASKGGEFTPEDCAKLAERLARDLRAAGADTAAEPCESLARMFRVLHAQPASQPGEVVVGPDPGPNSRH
jgi:hypothetical protein